MEMNEMIRELEDKLRKAKAQKKDWEAKEKFWMEAVKSAQKEMAILDDDIGNMEVMIEAAKGIHHTYKDEKDDKAKNHVPKGKKKVETIDPKHRKAMILQLNQYDNVTNRWRTQGACAKELNIAQSGISRLMKLDKNQQIQKKGYALVWQY